MKQLNGNTLKDVKFRMFKEQNGKCKLCGRDLDSNVLKNHLDHDHALDGPNAGRVRSLLCCLCNAAEGKIKHKFISSGLAGRGVDYIEWLESLTEYLKQDYSSHDFHPNYITDKIKQFKRLNLPEMRIEMNALNYEFDDKDTKSELIKKYSKQLRKEQKNL